MTSPISDWSSQVSKTQQDLQELQNVIERTTTAGISPLAMKQFGVVEKDLASLVNNPQIPPEVKKQVMAAQQELQNLNLSAATPYEWNEHIEFAKDDLAFIQPPPANPSQ